MRMVSTDASFQIDVAEQRPRLLVPASHPRPPKNAEQMRRTAIPLANDLFNNRLDH
jgi:hypothetical protein